MAKKRKQTQIEKLPGHMQEHLLQLGLSSIQHYKNWCRQHNFSCGLNKNSRQRQKELDFVVATKASEIMTAEKKERNLKEVLPQIYRGELSVKKLRNATTKEIADAFQNSSTPEVLLKLLLYLEENSELLKDATYITGITAIANHAENWIRPLETWHVKRHNRDSQFSELARHLFAAYHVPTFMDQVWFAENETYQNWYKHIGAGQNIRTAPDIPTSLTKKMAHHFLAAPKQYTVEEALRWGQVHALGGDKRLVDALRGTRLIGDFNNDDFWLNVFRFFIAHPMLDVSHVHPILDFIWNRKFENQHIFVERGVTQNIGPAQPNFSMRGRTPETLLRQVDEWHRELGRETRTGNLQWAHSDISEFRFREGSEQKRNLKFWYIRELLSTGELGDEGRRMGHCVRTYARSCHAGQKSIWSMETEDAGGRRKILTIEISERLIRQVRGKRNRLPTLAEKSILDRWAAREKLKIAGYVQFERS